jgi:hypothetical protein
MSVATMRVLQCTLLIAAALVLASCSDEHSFPVRTYNMGEKVQLGRITYVVFETQWLTQLGDAPDARIPQHRFFLVRVSAVNSGSSDISVPAFSIQDANGNSYPEISDGTGVPQYIGFLRSVKPAESALGNALFDAPPRRYKLKITDEDGERTALIDMPLTFGAETPDIPVPEKKQ